MRLSKDTRAGLRLFAFYLVNRTVDLDILPMTIDYSCILREASEMEQVFAIWANVIELDSDGKVLNGAFAHRRAAQYIRSYVDSEYVVDPPFEDWELEPFV